jgi:hypothetical protein
MVKQLDNEICECGHSKKYHHLVGVGFPVKYINECRYRHRFEKCPCKKFVPKKVGKELIEAGK